MSIDSAKRFIEEFNAGKFGDQQNAEHISVETQALQEGKDEFQSAFIESESEQRIMEYLFKEALSWPTIQDTDAKLKASRQEKKAVKKRFEVVKDQISEILQSVVTEYKLLQEQVKLLEEKVKVYENKRELFISKQNIDPSVVKTAVEKCQQAVDTIQTELESKKKLQNQLEASNDYLKQAKCVKTTPVEDKVIHRAKNILEFLESLSGVKVVESERNTITVELPEKCLAEKDLEIADNTLTLTLTLHFKNGCHGSISLTDVKVNVDHFNIQDIIQIAVQNNDVPYLIRTVQTRWSQHYPMLWEMEILNKHHAVDWIQNESRLRVLVGNCGKVMYTLAIPEDYPHSRNITLVDTYGTEMVDVKNLPGQDATLLDWVKHLENLYEEPA